MTFVRVMKMCEAMEALIAEGREDLVNQAREQEKENTILRLFRKGKKSADMMDATDWTAERIQDFLRARNLQPAQ